MGIDGSSCAEQAEALRLLEQEEQLKEHKMMKVVFLHNLKYNLSQFIVRDYKLRFSKSPEEVTGKQLIINSKIANALPLDDVSVANISTEIEEDTALFRVKMFEEYIFENFHSQYTIIKPDGTRVNIDEIMELSR